jgi:hypothetical protein
MARSERAYFIIDNKQAGKNAVERRTVQEGRPARKLSAETIKRGDQPLVYRRPRKYDNEESL